MYPTTTTTTTKTLNATIWTLKDKPIRPSEMSLGKLGKPNRNSKRRKYFSMESSKRRRKRIETPKNYYANDGALAPIKQSPGYSNVVDLTKPNRKPPTATYVQKSQLFSPVEKATPLASVGRNAVTPSSGFLLTPSNSNYDFKKRPDDAFLAKFSDRKAAIDAKETSRPASPAHTKPNTTLPTM